MVVAQPINNTGGGVGGGGGPGVLPSIVKKGNLKYVLRNGHKADTFAVSNTLKRVTIIQNTLGNEDEELVVATPSNRNWRGIFIALLVIAAVLSLIVFSIFLLTPPDLGSRIKGQRLTLSDVTGDSLRPRPVNATWISDSELVYRDPSGGLSVLNLENFTISTLMTNSTFRQLNAVKFIVSPDVKFVLLLSDLLPVEEEEEAGDEDEEFLRNGQPARRRARYHVFEVQTKNHFPLSPKESGLQETPHLQHALWAPNESQMDNQSTTGTKGTSHQAVAFVHENDIYYKPKVQQDLVCRITTTGRPGVVYNGVPDWFYSHVEELRGPTMSFSPDALYLAFLSFNDTLVPEYKYTRVGEGGQKQRYPEVHAIRYPRTNTPNPNVTVFVVNLSNPKFLFPQPIRLPEELNWDNQSYVGAMRWASRTALSVTLTNRHQSNATTLLCTAPQFSCRVLYVEQSLDNSTVLPSDLPHFASSSPAGAQDLLLRRLLVRDGEFGFFRHLALVSGVFKRVIPLTMGRFEVEEVLGWDEEGQRVYFVASLEDKPGQRHLFEVPLRFNLTEHSASRLYVEPTHWHCLSCDNSPSTYSLLQQNFTNTFSSRRPSNLSDTIPMKAPSGQAIAPSAPPRTGKVFLKVQEAQQGNKLTFLDSFVKLQLHGDSEEGQEERRNLIRNNCLFNRIRFSPRFSYYLQECLGPERPATFLVCTRTNRKVFVLDSNDHLGDALNDMELPQVRKMSVELKEGSVAQVRLFLPPDLRDDEEAAFPLILQVDAGPGSQLVDERFHVDWNWYLAGNQQMIVAQIDGRGSGHQGEFLRSKVRGRLGGPEVEDQLAVLTYLRDTFSYIDRRKICAYGSGYGGYAATATLAQDTEGVLQCAVAINPITAFGLYNSFFTERHLHSAEESGDLAARASQLEGKQLLVIHGTADQEVQPQHSMTFARALIGKDVVFRQMVYPDEGHQLRGVLGHVYRTMEEFFKDVFEPVDRDEWDPTGFFAFRQ